MKSIYLNFSTIFPLVELFTASIPSYSIGIWCFVFCSKKFHPLNDFRESKVIESSMKNQYYNAAIHKASFALPTFLKTALNPESPKRLKTRAVFPLKSDTFLQQEILSSYTPLFR